MLFGTYQALLTLALGALYVGNVVAGGDDTDWPTLPGPPKGAPLLAVDCLETRSGPTKIKWSNNDARFNTGYLNVRQGQVVLEARADRAATFPFRICVGKYIGSVSGADVGHITYTSKCLVNRNAGLAVEKCAFDDDSSQTPFTFAAFKGTNSISAPAGGYTIGGKKGIRLTYVP